jgi:hypothetical protein
MIIGEKMTRKIIIKLSLVLILSSFLFACSSNTDASVARVPEPSTNESNSTLADDTVSEVELSPKELIYDYYCNISKTGNWEQCDEDSGTVKNFAEFGREIIYYRRFAVYEFIYSNGNKYTFDLQNSTIRFESVNLIYERDFLFKSYRGNVTRAVADSLEENFIKSFFDIFLPFDFIEENYGVKLQLSDFNSNWEALEEKETFLYVSPEEARAAEEEARAAELKELIEQIIISEIRYYRRDSEYIDGSFKITNNTGKTIRYMTMDVLYYNHNNEVIDSDFTNQGNLFNSASVTKGLINRIQGYSFSDIAYIDVVITSVDFDE